MSKARVARPPSAQKATPRFRPALGRARSAEPAKRDASVDGGSTSSDSSSSLASVRTSVVAAARRRAKVAAAGGDTGGAWESPVVLRRRCAFITANSDPPYVAFHDEEWGVPVHDDMKLFELFVLSMALAEFSWPMILKHRNVLRDLFENFDPATIANFSKMKAFSLKSGSGISLSDQKLRAVVENAKQVLKITEQFGSFDSYCWNFINHKPIINGYRFPHQVPIKTSKAEVISKDLIRRGFQCVGPTIVYAFMQAAGLVNDHLSCCFRYKECSNPLVKGNQKGMKETKSPIKILGNRSTLPD